MIRLAPAGKREVCAGAFVNFTPVLSTPRHLGLLKRRDHNRRNRPHRPVNTISMNSKIAVDLLIHARWVLPIRPNPKTVLSQHSLAVNMGKIVDILPTSSALDKYTATSELHRPKHALLPGLINTHAHSGMTLMRGCADDDTLHDWLHGRVWPIEGEFLGQEGFCHDGALLTAAEMTRGGTTTFNDMYWDIDAAAHAVSKAGMRAVLGMVLIGFPSAYATTTEEYLARGEASMKLFSNNDRLTFAYCPHAPYTVPDSAWEEVARRAQSKNILIHTHIHETAAEVTASHVLDRSSEACHRSDQQMRPLHNLDRLGVFNSPVIAAHMAHTNEADISILSKRNVAIAHCPTSNAKLAVGWCDTRALLDAGVTVGLGTDSACSNNSLDMFSEMKLAALLAKNRTGDATVLDAATALEMATINGAKALGLESRVGSIQCGKQADIITVELGTHAGNSPVFCVQSALVYAAVRSDVCDVFVDGDCLMKDKQLLKLDEEEVCRRAQEWADRIEKKFPLGNAAASK